MYDPLEASSRDSFGVVDTRFGLSVLCSIVSGVRTFEGSPCAPPSTLTSSSLCPGRGIGLWLGKINLNRVSRNHHAMLDLKPWMCYEISLADLWPRMYCEISLADLWPWMYCEISLADINLWMYYEILLTDGFSFPWYTRLMISRYPQTCSYFYFYINPRFLPMFLLPWMLF